MCKWVKYTQKFRSYRENYTVTMRDVTEYCNNPMKGIFCPDATEDTTRLYRSVSLKGSCPECPSGSK
ncbi:hypothetical protein HYQ44_001978 [Verticillium longisporum]|nr:hypothetical protein HYQ44_001978 [Verticillium longisporum]